MADVAESGAAVGSLIVSDLHLGASQGLLLDTDGSTVVDDAPLVAFVGALASLAGADRPELVLGGDAVEMALQPPPVAFAAFGRFVERLLDADVVADDVVYVPGNHDHHLWELTRQRWWLEALDGDDGLPAPVFSTELGDDGLPLAGLPAMVPAGSSMRLRAVYPNWWRPGTDGRAVTYHHGHYVEPLYHAMSTVDRVAFGRPGVRTVDQLERDNHAWVDFLWSALGTSGSVGTDLGTAYHLLPDRAALRTTVNRAVDRLVDELPAPRPLRWIRRLAVGVAVRVLAAGEHLLETRKPHGVLSRAADRGLDHYLAGPLALQLAEQAEVPRHATFVFGHTHKPFQDLRNTKGPLGRVAVHNTGGWVSESLVPQPTQGGQVVVVSEDGAVVSVELFRQAADGGAGSVRVRPPLVPDAAHRALHAELEARVHADRARFDALSHEIGRMLVQRRRELDAADAGFRS